MAAMLQLSGKVFDRLEVLYPRKERRGGLVVWVCCCSCYNMVEVAGRDLVRGNTRSCGCLQRERTSEINKSHGMCGKRIYWVWQAMLRRCYNRNNNRWALYGGRGIKVCKRWLKFENFYKDMGDPPFPGATLERKDNDGDYKPSNVRWATRRDQARNTRRTRMIEYRGETRPLREWCDRLNIPADVMYARLRKHSVEHAFNTPYR